MATLTATPVDAHGHGNTIQDVGLSSRISRNLRRMSADALNRNFAELQKQMVGLVADVLTSGVSGGVLLKLVVRLVIRALASALGSRGCVSSTTYLTPLTGRMATAPMMAQIPAAAYRTP